jgi:cytidyltransferase-like protein
VVRVFSRVYTGGTFDLFHAGHVNFLRQCDRIAGGGEVVVGLNPDEFIYDYKGIAPVYTYTEREQLLLGCKYVTKVVPNVGGRDSTIAIEQVDPDFIVIGSDWAKKDYYSQMGFTQKWLDDRGIILIYVPYTENISTTYLKERIMKR